jgi:hypothetical protein
MLRTVRVGRVSPTTSGSSNATLRHWLLAEPLVVGETRPTTLLFADLVYRSSMDGWTDELCPALR